MNTKKLFAIGIIFSIFAFEVNAQLIEELSAITNMRDSVNSNIQSEKQKPREIESIKAEISPQQREKERLKEGEKFGFSGRDDFIFGPETKPLNQPKKYFGYDYFEDPEASFIVDQIPVPANYIIGPGDELKISLYGGNSFTQSLVVSRDGEISIPDLGPIYVAGLSFRDTKSTIQKTVESQLIGTKVNISLGSLKTINIYVLGEAIKPGMYSVSGISTMTNAIFSSGGLKTSGSLRNIQLKRNGKTIANFDFYKLLLEGDTSQDERLLPGDVIFIPPTKKQVAIVGEVNRPAIYELMDGENAASLIQFAGGARVMANLKSIEIQRVDPKGGGYNLIRPNLDDGDFDKIEMKDGDTLSLNSLPNKINAAILLSGHSQNPGYHPWYEGMRLSDVIRSYDDLLPYTDLNYLLIKRENDKDSSIEVYQVSLEKYLNNPNSEENIALKKRDELIFFPSELKVDLIKTTKISIDENKIVNETQEAQGLREAEGLVFLAKREQEVAQQFNPITFPEDQKNQSAKSEVGSFYYKYTVFDYCELWDEQVSYFIDGQKKLAESSLISKELSFEGKQLDDDKQKLTQICRGQLIKPIIDSIEAQSSPERSQRLVEIYGNVSFPGKYPLTKNANITDALAASGGLKDMAFLREIDISRRSISGKEVTKSNFSVNYTIDNKKPLNPMDVIMVKKFSVRPALVEVMGEVFFPGIYPISNGETFADLIKRAGGITKDAMLKNVIYTKQDLARLELKRLEQAAEAIQREVILSSANNSAQQDDTKLIERLTSLGDSSENIDPNLLGRLVIDAEKILNGLSSDIALDNGDKIIIPRENQIVAVIGEVFAPNSHLYNTEYEFDDYINLSGGSTKYADLSSAYLIKGNGVVVSLNSSARGGFFRGGGIVIEPGDTIVVPLEIKSYRTLRTVTEITQILYQVGLAAAAVNSL